MIRQGLKDWAEITAASKLPDNRLYIAAHAALSFMTSLALTTKHKGFEEEAEWRVVYMTERDPLNYFKACKSYYVGPRGVEPKLKLKFGVEYNAIPETPVRPCLLESSRTSLSPFCSGQQPHPLSPSPPSNAC